MGKYTKRGNMPQECNVKSILGIYNTYEKHEVEKELRGVKTDIFNVYRFCLNANLMHLQLINDSLENMESAIIKHRPDVIWMSGHGITTNGISKYMTRKRGGAITGTMAGRYVQEYTNENRLQIYVLDFCQSGSFVDVRYKFDFESGNWTYNDVASDELVVDEVDLIVAICAAQVDKDSYETTEGGGELTTFMVDVLCEYGELSMGILRREVLHRKKNFVVTCNRKMDSNLIFWRVDVDYMNST